MNKLSVEQVPDPELRNDQDVIVRLLAGTTCGSDLHLIGGYIPAMRAGDVIGHEFVGEVVETGSGVRRHQVGDRVVVCSFVGCGRCWYCAHDLWSLCDNTNTNPGVGQALFGYETAGIFGYSHAMGGLRGSHAEYVRVPFADYGAFTVPEGIDDTSALFVSDSVPTGWMGADLGGVKPGDVVAVWGCGAVGQMAARAAILKGAERVISIDRIPERLA
ncbi:alcohol dehydrogenase catalytic domain-containing protein, partial [Streptomyces sp. TRM76130]|nr:alcohol dehydrogenase catalytic domain-containing protein [Streptomyces sp. TRM76130]